jgi:hypothetical protein
MVAGTKYAQACSPTKPGFVMAEIIFKQLNSARPLTPKFATDSAYLDVHFLTKS